MQDVGSTEGPRKHQVPDRLYHYTDLRGVRGIIDTATIRMTSAYWMDDTTEMFWFYDVVQRLLGKKPPEEGNIVRQRFEAFLERRPLSHVYCACFSREPDARSQWLEYADSGHGFCIGFDPTAFNMKPVQRAREVELGPVIYDQKEQEGLAEEIITNLRDKPSELSNKMMLVAVGHNMWWRAPFCKNPVFEGEREWRLVHRDDPKCNIKFREKQGRQLVPFIEFRLDPDRNPIREIRLGPRNRSQRNVDALGVLLRARGFDWQQISFRCSEVPLRAEY